MPQEEISHNRKGFSDTDIRKLNTLYKCKGYPQVPKHGWWEKTYRTKYISLHGLRKTLGPIKCCRLEAPGQ